MEYGLHPSLWRIIRKNHSGLIEVPLYGKGVKNGLYLGTGIIMRYKSCIVLSEKVSFNDICFKTLRKDTYNKFASKHLKGNNIPIGQNYF